MVEDRKECLVGVNKQNIKLSCLIQQTIEIVPLEMNNILIYLEGCLRNFVSKNNEFQFEITCQPDEISYTVYSPVAVISQAAYDFRQTI